MRAIPKRLQALIDRHPQQVESAWIEQDEYCAKPGCRRPSIWVELARGWRNPEGDAEAGYPQDASHYIHECQCSLAEAARQVRAVKPCACPDCST